MKRIHEIRARGEPTAIAIVDHDGREYSYAALNNIIHDVTGRLRRHGIRAGDRVLIVSENSVTYLVAIMALSHLDAWAVLVNARLTEAELARLTEVSDARCAIFTPEASTAAQAHAGYMGAITLGQLPCGDLLVSRVRNTMPEPVEGGEDQTAALIYTSGTVGEPKGVMLTHGNLLFMCRTSSGLRQIGPDDTTLAVLPGTHIFGLTSVFLAALMGGSRLIVMPRFDADEVLRHIRRDVTILPAVPQIFSALLKRLKELGIPRPEHTLRYIYAGGAPLDLSLKQRAEAAFGLTLHNGYGLTEASPGIATTRMDAPRSDAAVGRPIPGQEVRIHEPDEDGVGELWARGPNIMKGYFRNEQATQAALAPDGFLRTGDLARQDPDGTLHIAGRLKELIIHSGFNVYPPEVEAVLTAHPCVSTSAVIGRARNGNEEVLAFVTTQDRVSETELIDWVRQRMAAYKVPVRVIIADALPQAATGKILKHRLLEYFRAELDKTERDEHA